MEIFKQIKHIEKHQTCPKCYKRNAGPFCVGSFEHFQLFDNAQIVEVNTCINVQLSNINVLVVNMVSTHIITFSFCHSIADGTTCIMIIKFFLKMLDDFKNLILVRKNIVHKLVKITTYDIIRSLYFMLRIFNSAVFIYRS